MFKRIDHVGIITKDIEEAARLFSEVFGLERSTDAPFIDPLGEFKSVFLVAGEVTVELIEPINPNGALAKFLEKRGEGLHHISVEVENINQKLEALKLKGVRLIGEEAQVVGTLKVAFIHPSSTRGILIELTEKVST